MSKTKLIRCKTPHDVLVVKKREDFNALCDSMPANASNCGHNHLIVCGDAYFSTPKRAQDTLEDFYPAELPCPLCKSPSSVGRYGSRDVYHCTACEADITGIAWKYLKHD